MLDTAIVRMENISPIALTENHSEDPGNMEPGNVVSSGEERNNQYPNGIDSSEEEHGNVDPDDIEQRQASSGHAPSGEDLLESPQGSDAPSVPEPEIIQTGEDVNHPADVEGLTEWNHKEITYRLYERLAAGEKDDVLAIFARPAIDYTFEFEGRTLAEYYSAMCDERNLPEILAQLLKEGDALKYGEALYETGTPEGEKWAKSWYEERVAFYGSELLEKYIVDGQFRKEELLNDMEISKVKEDATNEYNTAKAAFLTELAASIQGRFPSKAKPEVNGLVLYFTRDDFAAFMTDDIGGWYFDLESAGDDAMDEEVYGAAE